MLPLKGIIDRFESGIVVIELENGKFKDFPIKTLSTKAEAGDVVRITELPQEIVITIDKEATIARKKKIHKLMNDVWAD